MCHECSAPAGGGQSARSGGRRKLHKCYASNHLRGKADQVGKHWWRSGARLPRPNLALARYARCNGRQCKVQGFRGGLDRLPGIVRPAELRTTRSVIVLFPAITIPLRPSQTVRQTQHWPEFRLLVPTISGCLWGEAFWHMKTCHANPVVSHPVAEIVPPVDTSGKHDVGSDPPGVPVATPASAPVPRITSISRL